MCNLGQGIIKKGIAEGSIAGRREGERIGEERGEKRSMKLIQTLMYSNRMEDCQRAIRDESYRRQLMKELGI